MTRQQDDRLKGTIKGDTGRQERLAAELRENLKRRKAQARAARAAEASTADPIEAEPPAGDIDRS